MNLVSMDPESPLNAILLLAWTVVQDPSFAYKKKYFPLEKLSNYSHVTIKNIA